MRQPSVVRHPLRALLDLVCPAAQPLLDLLRHAADGPLERFPGEFIPVGLDKGDHLFLLGQAQFPQYPTGPRLSEPLLALYQRGADLEQHVRKPDKDSLTLFRQVDKGHT